MMVCGAIASYVAEAREYERAAVLAVRCDEPWHAERCRLQRDLRILLSLVFLLVWSEH